MSYKRQAEAATAVATGKADVFYADSPVAGYSPQTDGQLEALGDVEGVAKQGIAIQEGRPAARRGRAEGRAEADG